MFPDEQFDTASSFMVAYHAEFQQALSTLSPEAIDRAAEILNKAYTKSNRVFIAGNGGSAALANLFATTHSRIQTLTDIYPDIVSLSANSALLTAIANDVGHEYAFSYQLRTIARPGDTLVTISSSGTSPNILRAGAFASNHKLAWIALTGFDQVPRISEADVTIHIDSANYGVVEDCHQIIIHALAQFLRQKHMPQHIIPDTTF